MLIRFFLIVRPWHPLVAGGLGVVVAAAGALVAAGRVASADALAPVLLLQTLAASSGFAGPARRGHYDFLIAGGYKRAWIALAHWAVSAAPGIAGCVVLGIIEFAFRLQPGVLTTAGLSGVVLASTLPWAVTVPLPRLTGGLVWIVLVVAGLTRAITVPPLVAVAGGAAAMAAAIAWIERADFPLETAQ